MKLGKFKSQNMCILFIILLFILVALIWTTFAYVSDKTKMHTYEPSEEQKLKWNEGQITFPSMSDITIYEEDTYIEVEFFNPELNNVYLTYQLYINDEVYYESKLISPGKGITEIKRKESLPFGTHQATIRIKSYEDEEMKIEKNGSEQSITIDVTKKERES